jgi:hypothetical protein
MKQSTRVCLLIFVVLAILHQDFWNWDNKGLVFGFMPVGLAYHALYSVLAAVFWLCVSRFAWPVDIERWADEGSGQ